MVLIWELEVLLTEEALLGGFILLVRLVPAIDSLWVGVLVECSPLIFIDNYINNIMNSTSLIIHI
jgi:hypothetical protein